jgi:hypothetical protein
VDGGNKVEASSVLNNATQKVVKNTFKHACMVFIVVYNPQVLKQQMKLTQAHGIYLTKEQHLLGMVNSLVKDSEVLDLLCCWWASEDFRVISEQNRHSRLNKLVVHYYDVDRHIQQRSESLWM